MISCTVVFDGRVARVVYDDIHQYCSAETITIRFAGWISGRIVSLQPDTDIQKLLSNENRIRIRLSETVLSIFRGFRLLEKVAHCTIIVAKTMAQSFIHSFIHSLSSEAFFQPSVPWLRVCLWCTLCTCKCIDWLLDDTRPESRDSFFLP